MLKDKNSTCRDVVVPNSLVRQLADPDPKSFFRVFSHWPLAVAFGILSLVNPKHPSSEVVVRPREILRIVLAARIIEKALAGANDKEGKNGRDIPTKNYAMVKEALITLFRTEFPITIRSGEILRQYLVHFLDSFGPVYLDEQGEVINIDLTNERKVNIGNDEERPVFALSDRRRPWRIAFRLNSELANELLAGKGHQTIYFGKVFTLLHRLSHDPAAIRVGLWIIGNREREIKTNRGYLYNKLISGKGHPTLRERDNRIEAVLGKLRNEGVISNIEVREYAEASRRQPGKTYLVITKSDEWHVPNNRDRGLAATDSTNAPQNEEKSEGEGLSLTKPPLYLEIEKDRKHNDANKALDNNRIEKPDSVLGIHALHSGDTCAPFGGYKQKPSTSCPDLPSPNASHESSPTPTLDNVRQRKDKSNE